MKIAIIEDSSVVAQFYKKFLSDTDYIVTQYGSTPEDIQNLVNQGADVVVCPGVPKHQEGPHIVSTIKSNPRFQDTSIIVSTTLETNDLQSEWELDTLDGILVKPFSREQLLNLFEQMEARRSRLVRAKPLVLVVDDSRLARSVLEKEIIGLGMDVLTAENGKQGLETALNYLPELVLSDITMPVMNGLEMCRELSLHPKTNQIPLVVISSLVNDENVRKWFRYGVSHFLEKPVNTEKLSAVVNDLLEQKDSRGRGSALVVENHSAVAAIVQRELNKIGVRSNRCTSVAELEAFLVVSRPDLITLSLTLPDGDGLSVCKGLRSRNELTSTALVIISDEAEKETTVKCLNAGASDFLTKPFTREEFHARIINLMRAKRLYDDLIHRNHMLEALAYRDGLTGLLNRRYLDEALDRELAMASENNATVGYLILDLDHFKKVNDTYGHKVGDEILKHVAAAIQENVGSSGYACRYGGEEMCVFLPQTSLAKSRELAERIRRECERKRFTEHKIQQTLSVGVSAFPEPSNRETLLGDADEALYRAKEGGRNRVVTHQE